LDALKKGWIAVGVCISALLGQPLPLFAQETEAVIASQSGPSVEIFTQNNNPSNEGEGSAVSFPRLPVQVTLSTQVGYDSNSDTSSAQSGSPFFNESVTLFYSLNTERTQLSLLAGGGYSYFTQQAGGQDYSLSSYITLGLTHNILQRLQVATNVYAAYQTEPDFSSDVGPNGRNGNYLHTNDTLSASYQWSTRLSNVTTYGFRLIKYDDPTVAAFSDRVEQTFGEQLRYNLRERTTLVGSYNFTMINYDSFPLDSATHALDAGFDQSVTPRLTVTARGGATFRSYSSVDNNQINPHFEGSVNYYGAHRSALSWTISYGVEEADTMTPMSRTTFRTGLLFSYALTSRITSNATLFYHHDEDQSAGFPGSSPAFSQNSIDISLNAFYRINRHFNLQLGFERSNVSAGGTTPGYSRNRYFSGLTFNF
jgi:hypothetical protein